MPMQCAYHPEREPVGACVECGRLICVECKALLGGKMYCTPCADKKFVHKEADTTSKPTTAATAASAAPAAQATTTESGQGSASVLPKELKKWSWGAFTLSWIWGIFNRVWLAFLVFIPGLNVIWIFVLGAKGTQWAWQNTKWNSLEEFRSTQKKWNIIGFILFLLWVLSLIFILINIGALITLITSGGEISIGQ